MTTTTTLKLVAPLLALALVSTACGGGDDAEPEAASDHNSQDVTFASEMIPHHAQAVEMADLAADRAASQEVRDLATDVSAAQEPEIEQMSAWLEAWGEEVPDTAMGTDMEGMDHGGTGDDGIQDMPGMMSSDEIDDLGSASGAAFDDMFLTMMIQHHEGAVELAQTEQSEGAYAEAIDLAETIETTQTEEIRTMQELLGSS